MAAATLNIELTSAQVAAGLAAAKLAAPNKTTAQLKAELEEVGLAAVAARILDWQFAAQREAANEARRAVAEGHTALFPAPVVEDE